MMNEIDREFDEIDSLLRDVDAFKLNNIDSSISQTEPHSNSSGFIL